MIALLATVPQAFGTLPQFSHRLVAAILVAIFAFFFATVSSRIVGLVGVTSNPTSGMTIAALLGTAAVFMALGWTDLRGQGGRAGGRRGRGDLRIDRRRHLAGSEDRLSSSARRRAISRSASSSAC